jgi:hypothetical protein
MDDELNSHKWSAGIKKFIGPQTVICFGRANRPLHLVSGTMPVGDKLRALPPISSSPPLVPREWCVRDRSPDGAAALQHTLAAHHAARQHEDQGRTRRAAPVGDAANALRGPREAPRGGFRLDGSRVLHAMPAVVGLCCPSRSGIEVVLAGDADEREEGIAARVGERRAHAVRGGGFGNRADRPLRGDPFPRCVGENGGQGMRPASLSISVDCTAAISCRPSVFRRMSSPLESGA